MNNKIELFEKIKTTINTTGVKSGKQNASLSKKYQLRHQIENRFIKDQEKFNIKYKFQQKNFSCTKHLRSEQCARILWKHEVRN